MKLRILILAAVASPCAVMGQEVTIQADLAHFDAGRTTRFSTRGHPRAGSIDLSVAIPNHWKSEEPGVGDVVRRFSHQTRAAHYSFEIKISDRQAALTSPAMIKAYFQARNWAETTAPPPCTVVSHAPIFFEGLPAGLIEYSQAIARPGDPPARLRHWGVVFVYDARLVYLTASVTLPESRARDLELRFDEARPLFQKMFENAVLHNVSGSNASGTPFTRFPQAQQSLANLDRPESGDRIRRADLGPLWFILSMAAQWMLVAVPALVIRFRIRQSRMTTNEAMAWSSALLLLPMAYLVAQVVFDLPRTFSSNSGIADTVTALGMWSMSLVILTYGKEPRIERGPPPRFHPTAAAPPGVAMSPADPRYATPQSIPWPSSPPLAQAFPAAAPPPAAPGYNATPYGTPQYGPQYGAPQYGATPYAAPADLGQQAYGSPQAYGPPQPYNAPQPYGAAPAYGAPPPHHTAPNGMPPGYGTPPPAPAPLAPPPQNPPALPKQATNPPKAT